MSVRHESILVHFLSTNFKWTTTTCKNDMESDSEVCNAQQNRNCAFATENYLSEDDKKQIEIFARAGKRHFEIDEAMEEYYDNM